MTFDWKHWVLGHAVWVAAVTVALIAGHAWLVEHDNRLLAAQQEKVSEQQIKDLQGQIAATNAVSTQHIKDIQRLVAATKTVADAVKAIPKLSDAPLNPRPAVDNPAQVSVDALPLVGVLGQAKSDHDALGACTDNTAKKDQIIGEKQKEIDALKKPRGFWHRTLGVAKAVGIGVGIGLLLGAHI